MNANLLFAQIPTALGRAIAAAALFASAPLANAQQPGSDPAAADPEDEVEVAQRRGAEIEQIEVYGRKRSVAEELQSVPVAVSAFNGGQLEELHVQDLQDLRFSMPNVALDDVGTAKGVANFAIRGIGVNSSIPSIDPAVGVFVDGVYMGINGGVVYDFFDMDGIEVLRGPQGLLFGRNVTGGAVLLRTRAPQEKFGGQLRVSTTHKLDRMVGGSLTGSLIPEQMSARVTAYFNDDHGWFENDFDGKDFGASETYFVRPSLSWQPSESMHVLFRYEHGDISGDGPAGQNRALFSDHTHDFAINEPGFGRAQWSQASAEVTIDVPYGTVTNLLAWRDYNGRTLGDIDSTPNPDVFFHSGAKTDQRQWSNELRYAGRFGNVALTAGVFAFTQELLYLENRNLRLFALDPATGQPTGGFVGPFSSTFGGEQDHESLGVFAQADVDLAPGLTLNLGMRHSYERKEAEISSFTPGGPCDYAAESCPAAFNGVRRFEDEQSWNDVTPRVGLSWQAGDVALLYGFWTKGFRSGGYNLRSTDAAAAPGPTDQEEVDSFEIGGKADWLDDRVRTNVAVFYNRIDDMQRELNVPSSTGGVTQIIRNTADATIYGFEAELQMLLTDSLLLGGHFGYTHGEYDRIYFDLSGDGMVDDTDYDLDIPRLSPISWGVSLTHDLTLGERWMLTSRVLFSQRDRAAYTDNNLGEISSFDSLDASFSFASQDGAWRFTVFGRNLLDQTIEGNETILGTTLVQPAGGTFAPLSRGREIGFEIDRRF